MGTPRGDFLQSLRKKKTLAEFTETNGPESHLQETQAMHLGRPPERDTIQSVVRYQAHLGDEASPTDKPLAVVSPACKARRTPNGMPYPSGDNTPKKRNCHCTDSSQDQLSLYGISTGFSPLPGKTKKFFRNSPQCSPGNDVQSMNKN